MYYYSIEVALKFHINFLDGNNWAIQLKRLESLSRCRHQLFLMRTRPYINQRGSWTKFSYYSSLATYRFFFFYLYNLQSVTE
jgi:hypothetical protein